MFQTHSFAPGEGSFGVVQYLLNERFAQEGFSAIILDLRDVDIGAGADHCLQVTTQLLETGIIHFFHHKHIHNKNNIYFTTSARVVQNKKKKLAYNNAPKHLIVLLRGKKKCSDFSVSCKFQLSRRFSVSVSQGSSSILSSPYIHFIIITYKIIVSKLTRLLVSAS